MLNIFSFKKHKQQDGDSILSEKRASFGTDEHTPPVHDESNWLVSYADMMTLLCGFFIMMFTLASLEKTQYEKIKEALSKEFNSQYKPPNEDLGKFMSQVLQEAGVEKETSIKIDANGVAITFESTMFFDTMSAEVSVPGQIILGRLLDGIQQEQQKEGKQYRIVVEGHTDGRPITGGNYPSNWELSGARAARVVRMFLDHGFSPGLLTSVGYADTRPQVEARTPAGAWDEAALAKNRRVVIRILDTKITSIPYPESAPEPAKSAD